MMTADDVAEVVVFVLERPRRLRILETALPADDGGELGMTPVQWGIVSTAHINRLVIPGRARVAEGRAGRRWRAATGRAPRRTRASGRSRAPTARTRSCSPTRRSRRVYISLPNTLHCEWSIKAVEAGKHVLCEKPFSRHPDEVEAAFDAAERAGRFLSEAFMYRHNPQTAEVASLVADGAIGELRLVRVGVQLLALRRRTTSACEPTSRAAR